MNILYKRTAALMIGAFTILAGIPALSQAALTPYGQSFEGMTLGPQAQPTDLANDGWLGFADVWSDFVGGTFVYNYGGTFPAPNSSGAFSEVVTGQGGPTQGDRQLSFVSDYNNLDHGPPNFYIIHSLVFQEQMIGAADIGKIVNFQFDYKTGNVAAPSTAGAFVKTIDPSNSFAQTNYIPFDTTTSGGLWANQILQLDLSDPLLENQLLQFGFENAATNFDPSGVFYDNINVFFTTSTVVPEPSTYALLAAGLGVAMSVRRRKQASA